MNYFFAAIFAFVLTFILVKLALKVFPKAGLMDRPHKYGLKRAPIPYYGGTVIVTVFMIAVLIFVPLDIHVFGFLIGALLIAGVSFLDDMFGLSPYIRLVVQAFAALILVFFGVGINSITNPFGPTIILDQWRIGFTLDNFVFSFGVLSAIFVVIWVVSIINTMNWLDGLNGLPSGVSAIASFTIFILSIRPDIHFNASSQVSVAMISIILAAICAAFVLFDFYPAKILMGDTGSMFLGFVLATLAILSGGKIATAFLVLGFPLLDAAWVIIRRIVEGKSPVKGDLKHLHHRLLLMGWGDRKVILFIYGLCALFGLMAVLMVSSQQKLYALIILLILMVIVGTLAVLSARKTHSMKKQHKE